MNLMAIINVTPDSFYDGGQHAQTEAAVAHALHCVADGADILDIGGESTRPGSEPVSVEEEIRRVIPVVAGIRRANAAIPLSIDTTKSAVIRAAAEHGIQYANDVTALRFDPEMAASVAQLQLKVILMHMQGTPQTMQQSPQYGDVVGEVKAFLEEQMAVAMKAGIPKEKIYIDPGIGFGKTLEHNLALLKNLSALAELGCPLLVGTSRKSFIAQIMCGEAKRGKKDEKKELASVGMVRGVTSTPADRLPGSLATLPAMLRAGVTIVRTHDVAATRQFLRVHTALSNPCLP